MSGLDHCYGSYETFSQPVENIVHVEQKDGGNKIGLGEKRTGKELQHLTRAI